MSTHKGTDIGSVVTCIISQTRILLVKDESRINARWKLPGGNIESSDGDVIAAAIREVREETGVKLLPEEVHLRSEERRTKPYYPYCCVANVTEEKIDTRLKIADENGHPIRVADFKRSEVPTMVDLLERHRVFVREAGM
ncbi:MAG: NUDIX hydrolase [bacterium]|nr:NUDIX hydrolase [bacterium]